MFTNHDLEKSAAEQTGLAARVMQYVMAMHALVARSKQPGFDGKPTEIEPFIAPDFRRIGSFKEEMDRDSYMATIVRWIPQAEWEGSFHRIAEVGRTVYLELEERTGAIGKADTVNSMTVYEFDDEDRIRNLYVYLQEAPGATHSQDTGWTE